MTGAGIIAVQVNCPSLELARAIARAAVERRLAACANIHAPMESHYRWDGALESGTELPVILKTTAGRMAAIRALVAELHPFAVPCVVAFPVSDGLPDYLDWVRAETAG